MYFDPPYKICIPHDEKTNAKRSIILAAKARLRCDDAKPMLKKVVIISLRWL